MIVNGEKLDINKLVNSIDFNASSLNNVGSFMLTNYEIDVLNRNFIDYKSASSLKDLMIKIEDVIEDENIDEDEVGELDYILDTISERDYYMNTKK